MLFPYLQYILPQHLLSSLAGKLAEAKTPWLKNFIIQKFMRTYQIDLNEAIIQDPTAFIDFNDFFTRRLKPTARPIDNNADSIISPADGTLAEIGAIHQGQLLQAKNMYFNLDTLLANDLDTTRPFANGQFATVYLAPNNYHRVHMPVDGQLLKTIYVPGKLFSVNRMTSTIIPNLYARNERLIAVFETAFGKMAVVMVGALIVGSIQMAWMHEPVRGTEVTMETPDKAIQLKKGEELGLFKLGSTVVILFEDNKIRWADELQAGQLIQMGKLFGIGIA